MRSLGNKRYLAGYLATAIAAAGLSVGACLMGCNAIDAPKVLAADASDLSGCWSITDTVYREAGRTTYDVGVLTLAQHGAAIAGGIAWSNPDYPPDSLIGSRDNDSLSLKLILKGDTDGPMLHGVIQDGDHFHVSQYWLGSGNFMAAAKLAKCPDANVAHPDANPKMMPVQPSPDSVAVGRIDSTGLNTFASYAYFGDSDVVRFSKANDTLTFTYRSYQDRERKSKSIFSDGFSLLTAAQGEKVIYGSVYPYYNDGIDISDSSAYSLNENIVIPGGLPKGKYKLVMRLQVECFCLPHGSDFYVKEFTIE